MTKKGKILDFLCAFVLFAIVLVSVAALAGGGFFDGMLQWRQAEGILTVFGSELVPCTNILSRCERLLSFYDNFFGGEFSSVMLGAAEWTAEYVKNAITLFYSLAQMLVGAK